jgi:hypothetical protein
MRRLELLNRRVDAQILSRLASNGVYWVASEADFPVKAKYADAVAAGADPFVVETMDLWGTSIRTPGSALAAVPFVARAKMEVIKDGIRYDDFAKLVDPELRADREFEIRRLATAMDVPPEVLLGMVGMNHWGAWQVEESALKTTVTSLLELICWSLTTGYLRPALGALGSRARLAPLDQDVETIPGAADRIVWYDLSELAVRPDRSQDTITMHGTLAVTDAALARETGLSEDDLLVLDTPEGLAEATRRIGLKLATGAVGTVELGLELLGIEHEAKADMGVGAPPGGVLPGDDEEGADDGALPPNDDEQAPPDTAPANGDRAQEPVPA